MRTTLFTPQDTHCIECNCVLVEQGDPTAANACCLTSEGPVTGESVCYHHCGVLYSYMYVLTRVANSGLHYHFMECPKCGAVYAPRNPTEWNIHVLSPTFAVSFWILRMITHHNFLVRVLRVE